MLRPARTRIALALSFLLLLTACSDGGPSTSLFTGDSGMPLDSAGDVAADMLAGMDATMPPDGIEPPQGCKAGDMACINGKLATCDPTFGWLLEACPAGTACVEGECVESLCKPLEARCTEEGVQICAPDGYGWSVAMPCPEGKICQEGSCVAPTCTPGTRVCADNKVLECAEDGIGWLATPCAAEEVCFDGYCIECVKDSDCAEGLSCEEGLCIEPPLEILTQSLPDGVVGEAYEANLVAEGGMPPYVWTTVDGELPAGLTLLDEGFIEGLPEEEGEFAVTLEVADDLGNIEEREFTFAIFGPPVDLIITTGSPLPSTEEGEPYFVQLEATGGASPYFWGLADGALPAGLVMTADGTIEGIPADHGTFEFKVKVFDNSEPVAVGTKTFQLTIKVAPLEILGNQEYDLFVVKVIVLPLITTVENIPIPYSTQLQAKGGVKPYHWSEQPLPDMVGYLIPNGGLPDGLTLEEDGELHGSSTDTQSIVNVSIPFTGIDLTGYFFTGRVEDSQDPPDSEWAIYLIPTVPVAW